MNIFRALKFLGLGALFIASTIIGQAAEVTGTGVFQTGTNHATGTLIGVVIGGTTYTFPAAGPTTPRTGLINLNNPYTSITGRNAYLPADLQVADLYFTVNTKYLLGPVGNYDTAVIHVVNGSNQPLGTAVITLLDDAVETNNQGVLINKNSKYYYTLTWVPL